MAKMAFIGRLATLKLISRKIRVTEKAKKLTFEKYLPLVMISKLIPEPWASKIIALFLAVTIKSLSLSIP